MVKQAQSTKQQVKGPGSLFLLGPGYCPKKDPHILAISLGTGKKDSEEVVSSQAWLQSWETPRGRKVPLNAFTIKILKVRVPLKNVPPKDSIWNFGELPNTR